MPKVIYYVASSLDGFIATEGNSLDWLLDFGFASFQDHYDQFISGVGALIMGAQTYEWIRREQPDTWDYGELPCLVLTHRELQAPPNSGVRFTSGDAGPVLEQALLLAEGRNVWVVGGGNGAAHGGTLPLLFDDLFGMVIHANGRPIARTGYLHVNYRKITPIETELVVDGWVDRVEGRKAFCKAELRDLDGNLLADSEALMIQLLPGQQ